MLSKKVKSRIVFLLLFLTLTIVIIFFVLSSLEKNVVYFYSPTEIYYKSNISFDKKIRLGGLVNDKSISKQQTTIYFIITDLKNEIMEQMNFIRKWGGQFVIPIPNLQIIK